MPKVKGARPTKRDKRSKVTTQSRSRDLVPVPSRKEQMVEVLGSETERRLRLTKTRLKELSALTGSEFKLDLGNVFAMLDGGATPEALQEVLLRAYLGMIVNAIPAMENELNNNPRESTAYALNSMVSQTREILNDLRGLSDSKNMALTIATSIIDPAYSALANTYLMSMVAMGEEIIKLVPVERAMRVKQTLQTFGTTFGQYLDVSRETIKLRLNEEL